jgi:hypothetical protein
MLCDLMIKIFERHGSAGSGDLHLLRPIGGSACFRDGYRVYDHPQGAQHVLFYDRDLGNGRFTSCVVREIKAAA